MNSLTLAGIAQMAEHLTCNHEVASSILAPGSIFLLHPRPSHTRSLIAFTNSVPIIQEAIEETARAA